MKRLIRFLTNALESGVNFTKKNIEVLVRGANAAEVICIVYHLEDYKVVVLVINIALNYLNSKLKKPSGDQQKD